MKKYQVIYADPPWPVKKIIRKSRPNQKENLDYPTMSVGEIAKLPIENLADENSHLFIWTTHKYLPETFEIMRRWGFKYQRTITWDKNNGMCLFGFHHRTEFLLHGYKGKIAMYPKQKAVPTIFTTHATRNSHSRKPDCIRKAIEIFGIDRIELFSRDYPSGWDIWGNEVESNINMGDYSYS